MVVNSILDSDYLIGDDGRRIHGTVKLRLRYACGRAENEEHLPKSPTSCAQGHILRCLNRGDPGMHELPTLLVLGLGESLIAVMR